MIKPLVERSAPSISIFSGNILLLQSQQNTLAEFRAGEFLTRYWAKEEKKKQLRISGLDDGWSINQCWVRTGRCWRFKLDSQQCHSSENKLADVLIKTARAALWKIRSRRRLSGCFCGVWSDVSIFQSRAGSSEEAHRRSLWRLVPLKTINSF